MDASPQKPKFCEPHHSKTISCTNPTYKVSTKDKMPFGQSTFYNDKQAFIKASHPDNPVQLFNFATISKNWRQADRGFDPDMRESHGHMTMISQTIEHEDAEGDTVR
ncbi:hypothetical protein CEXT_393371 [Caerostris extrusa]|uniref:Uncharacterized protein n=1 Tax=Caerostris extrusa TaxID=172846 RepID=A0AAV4NVX7_CAEEX|nr:hypothetical protein CEXT_393371 [Caerostris extrusa]